MANVRLNINNSQQARHTHLDFSLSPNLRCVTLRWLSHSSADTMHAPLEVTNLYGARPSVRKISNSNLLYALRVQVLTSCNCNQVHNNVMQKCQLNQSPNCEKCQWEFSNNIPAIPDKQRFWLRPAVVGPTEMLPRSETCLM